jgi:hypothetical protein
MFINERPGLIEDLLLHEEAEPERSENFLFERMM